MMSTDNRIKIKGSKDGLIFILDASCPFSELLEELREKLQNTHQQILSGPSVQVRIQLGARILGDAQKEDLLELFKSRENLQVTDIVSDHFPIPPAVQIAQGIVRSGQTRHFEGNILFLGDINPGGLISSNGDIYILGSLKGIAHAGFEGDEQAVIAASHLKPTQLRIAEVVSRPPDEWGVGEMFMEFAYLQDQIMKIDRINNLQQIRPEAGNR